MIHFKRILRPTRVKFLNALNKVSGIGTKRIELLLNFFPTPEDVWRAPLSELIRAGLGEKTSEKLVFERKQIDPSEEWEKMSRENIRMTRRTDDDFPVILKEIPNPPYTIYTKGGLDLNERPMIAIVGARKYTSYGSQIAGSFAKELAESGMVVVSGMAIGIDTFAHRGALGKGPTVAVLGNSLDDRNIYPQCNFALSREIISKGALVSEYPIETLAGKLTFPARNRIIAGLAVGTLIVEAGEKSGALITAQNALDFNREVFAVPGSIFSPVSQGANNLIKNGAKLVTGIKDILEELNLNIDDQPVKKIIKNPANPEETVLLKVLSSDPVHIDSLARLSKLQPAVISSTLAMMELKGWIKNIGGQNYIVL